MEKEELKIWGRKTSDQEDWGHGLCMDDRELGIEEGVIEVQEDERLKELWLYIEIAKQTLQFSENLHC